MQNINSVVVSGNLTREPELKETAGGMSILTFGIACNDSRKNQQTGEYEDYPNYLDCVVFGNRALGLNKVLAKGKKVVVHGKLNWSSWERDGQKRSKIDILVDMVDLAQQQQPQQTTQQTDIYSNDDIPF